MSDPKIITADKARALLDALRTEKTGPWYAQDDALEMVYSVTSYPKVAESDAALIAAAPSLAATVVAQAEQIKRLQAAVRFLESVWGSDVITQLREKGILIEGGMR